MKKFWILLLSFCFYATVHAQMVDFRFTPESSVNASVKAIMEKNATGLLNEIQKACNEHRNLKLDGISMQTTAKERLKRLWDDTRFGLDFNKVATPCVRDFEGYQARDILVNLTPSDPETYTGELARYLTISFDKKGVITGARFALSGQNVAQVMNQGSAVEDAAKRHMLLKFLEDFLGYYNERNIDALQKVYSDDALIITGSVVQKRVRRSDVTSLKTEIRYNKMSKEEYLKSLKGIFERNKEAFHVEFDKIEVAAHPKQKDYYGIKVHQKWDTKHYQDDGWVFLLWDFRNPDEPVIHVRTWQPFTVEEHEIFSLGDFQVGADLK